MHVASLRCLVLSMRVVLILTLLVTSWLGSGMKVASAQEVDAQLLRSFDIFNTNSQPYGPIAVDTYVYSEDGINVVKGATSLPAKVKWAAIQKYKHTYYPGLANNLTYLYSRNQVVSTATDVNQLPADARWVTISGFGMMDATPISQQVYQYSVDGTTVLTGSTVPAEAVWATLYNFIEKYGSNPFNQNVYPTYKAEVNVLPKIVSTQIASNGANPLYAKSGDHISLTLTASELLETSSVNVNIAGEAALVQSIDPKTWKAELQVSPSTPEGITSYSIDYADLEGGLGVPYSSNLDSSGKSVYIDTTSPVLAVSAAPLTQTNGDVTISISTTEAGSGTAKIKWANGNQNVSYFATGGTIVSGSSFVVSANDTYTVYAEDTAGNSAVQTISVTNIDKVAPTIALSASPGSATNTDVTITASIADGESGLAEQKWASGDQDVSYFATNGTSLSGSTFVVSTNGTYTVFAKDQVGNTAVKTIAIGNIDKEAPAITLSATPGTPTNTDVTVTATITDAANGIAEKKWASGDQAASYFVSSGTSFTGSTFTVSTNGTYTVYAKDSVGNAAVKTIAVGSIDKTAPSIVLAAAPVIPTNTDVTVTATITDGENSIAEQKWASGDLDAAYFASSGTSLTGSTFAVPANGTYTVFAKDVAGNTAVKTIEITNIDKEVPTITLSASPTQPTNGDVTVTATIADAGGSGIDEQKWAIGDQTASYFSTGGTSLTGSTFTVTTNGTYTVYARDKAGNTAVQTIEITNIDKESPTITVSASPTQATNGDVTITTTIVDAGGSGIDEQKWANGDQTASYFSTGGSNLTGSTFTATANGTYTVYAKDKAGNTAVQTIEIMNIDKEVPTITVSASPTQATNGDVTITATIVDADGSGIDEQKWAIGDQTASYFTTSGTSFTGSTFTVTANGTYTVYVKDKAGNTAVKTIEITTIDKVAPVITLSASPTQPTKGDVTVTATIADAGGSGIDEQKWASGDQTASYFATSGTGFAGSIFTVSTNGIYTVYAKDNAGNETVNTIEISNIDTLGPTIALSTNPTKPTSGKVTISVTVTQGLTAVKVTKWANGDQDKAYFAGNGTVLADDSFTVSRNGIYTVYAKDELGNETVKTIKVDNIRQTAYYPVTGVSVDQGSIELQENGNPITLTATITPSYATLHQVTWSSSDEKVATVDQNGVVTPHAAGEAVITVKTVDGNFTAESKVTVQAVTLTALELQDTSLLLKPGKSTRIKVYAVYSDGTKAEISRNKGTAYKTDSSLVRVDKGLIRTGKKEGEASVSIQFEGMTAELLVVVNKKQLEALELPVDSVTLEQGEENQLHANAKWSNKDEDDVTDTALWFSTDDKIVSVEQGKIQALEPGTATITVVYGDKMAAIEVEITEAKKIRRLTASKSSVSLKEGNRQKITLTAIFTDNTKSTVTEKAEWQSDDEEIAKVEAGMIKAVAPGTATVTATYRGKVYKIKVKVNK